MKDRRYQLLRDQLDYRLTSAELDGVPVEKAMADLIKLSLTLAVALDGPQSTEEQITAHLAHMREQFPDMYHGDGHPQITGNA